MAWALQDCDRVLKLRESQKDFSSQNDFSLAMKEKLQAEE